MSADLLVIGANGQVGWEITRRASKPMSVHALTRSHLDITDASSVERHIKEIAPGAVINAAAYTAVDRAENEHEQAFSVNRDGAANLAAACRGLDVPLIHLSTDYVFDGTKKGPYIEKDAAAPIGVYGASKLAGETAVIESGCRHVILRTSWVYGVHGANFVKTMLRLSRERPELSIVDDQFGCPTFAGDIAQAVIEIARRFLSGDVPTDGAGLFHCAGRGSTTWFDFAQKIFEISTPVTQITPEIKPISTAQYPTAARRPVNSVLDCAKLATVYEIALRPWEDALAAMLQETLSTDNRAQVS